WRISSTPPGTVTCVNTTDIKGPATGVYDTFPITAPMTEGVYNAYFIAAEDSNNCTSGISATYTMPGTAVVTVTTKAFITSVTGPANGTYNSGQTLDFLVTYSKNVNVDTHSGANIPQIGVTIGSTLVQAKYVSGTGTSVLTFRYTVLAGDLDTNGITSAANIALVGGTIKDSAGVNALLTFTPPDTTGVLVDGGALSVTIGPPSATVAAAGPVSYTVTY